MSCKFMTRTSQQEMPMCMMASRALGMQNMECRVSENGGLQIWI